MEVGEYIWRAGVGTWQCGPLSGGRGGQVAGMKAAARRRNSQPRIKHRPNTEIEIGADSYRVSSCSIRGYLSLRNASSMMGCSGPLLASVSGRKGSQGWPSV